MQTFGRFALSRRANFSKESTTRWSQPRLRSLEDRVAPATFLVSNTLDSGVGSLRQAIIDANNQAGADTIVFDSVVLFNTINVSSTLTITDPVFINGPVPDALTIKRSGTGPVFTIDKPGFTGTAVTIRGTTITGGTASAIYLQDEALTLEDTSITGNTAVHGGGVYVRDSAASLTIRNTSIENNKATSHGGGVYFFSSGSLLIENSTIAGNQSTGGAGGGVYFFGAAGGGTLTVRNSTISGNYSAQEGGGIALRTFSGTLLVQNSTITENVANSVGGGGIARNAVSSGVISIESTIVSGNISNSSSAADVLSAGTVNVNYSAIGKADGFTLTGNDNVPFGAELYLEPLNYYGYSSAPVKTHAIAYYSGSPCINAGSNPAGLTTDQRGVLAQRVSGGRADIGAVEFQEFVVTNTNDSGPGSLRSALDSANALAGSRDFVRFDASYFATGSHVISLTSGALSITDPVSVYGPRYPAFLSIVGNKSSRILNVSNKSVGGYGVYLYDMQFTNGASDFGGGIRLDLGRLSLTRCPVYNCAASVHGGGIYVAGNPDCSLLLYETFISGNQASGNGGGIYFYNGGFFSIERSTVNDNKALSGTGGGLYFYGSPSGGNLTIANSTFSGNTSGSTGGGIFLNNFSGALNVSNSTITKNSANGGLGGGVAMATGSGTIALTSTIVSGNSNPVAPDISSPGKVLVDYCAVGNSNGFTLTGANNLPFGVDLKLSALGFHGGWTPTHLPSFDSPVVNKGANPFGWPLDQSGYPRVLDLKADIGSVEAPFLMVRNVNDSGAGSLRQQLIDANAMTGLNVVTFDPIVFSTPQTINLTSGELVVTDEVWIDGQNSVQPTIDAKGSGRVIRISLSNPSIVLLRNLKIQGGNATTGGGISVTTEAALQLVNCTVSGNTASGRGGGVFLSSGCTLSIENSTIANNSAGVHGGGIYFFSGGFFYSQQSTISGNQALGGAGGGLYFFGGATQPLYVVNSTISGNQAYSEGGGIALRGFSGTLNVQNSTITANHAFGSFGGAGGGISNNTAAGWLNLSSTIVSGNINGNAADVFSVSSVSMNYCAVGESKGFTYSGGNNLPFGANLYLGPLQNNGGPTLTHAFNFYVSPLRDSGTDNGRKIDQRGGDRVSGAQADIGAFEQQFFLVTNVNDSGTGSLREAVGRANQLAPSADWIIFDPAVFATDKTIGLTTGEISISDSVSIVGGSAAGRVTINGNSISRVFNVDGPGTLSVELNSLTITGGFAPSGGGISVSNEKLALFDCEIYGNSAYDSGGGGIWLGAGAQLDSEASTIRNNNAFFYGGGVHAQGGASINISYSTISGNAAGWYGGGLMMNSGGNLQILASTISGNQSDISGGGVCLQNELDTAIIRNSTISSNSAKSFGGGINLRSFIGLLDVYNTTFTANTANKGGGLARESGVGSIALESTIVSGDSASVIGPDLYSLGTVTAKTSLIGSIAGVTTFVSDAVTQSLLGKAPLLGSLQYNGGPTKTHALLAGSPAINNGSNPWGFATDQRMFKRSVGFGVDIGAFELQAPPRVQSVVINNGAAQRSKVTTVAVTFDTIVTLTPTPSTSLSLIRQSDGKSVDLTVDLSLSTSAQTVALLTFHGALSDFGSLQDGRYTLTIPAANVRDPSNQLLDGNGDGVGGDPYVLSSTGTTGIFRLFGDANGDGSVTAVDFNAFRLVYGTSGMSIFDFEGDNQVTAADFNQFRLRYGVTI